MAGILGLWWSSDIAVNAARRIALRLGVSELVIGLTITSIGTSLPEISTNIAAGLLARKGLPSSGIAVGNIIGSCMSQITIILGIVGLFANLYIQQRSLRRDGIAMLLALFVMYLAASDGMISRLNGVTLVLLYVAYLVFLIKQEKPIAREETPTTRVIGDVFLTLGGIGVVVFSARVVVENGVGIAQNLGLPVAFMGILVGLGNALPELSVSLRALSKKAHALSLGNLIGSNITDPLLSIGIGASLYGFAVEPILLSYDFVYWAFATAIALLLLWNNMNLNRKESSVLIALYLMFIYLHINFI